MEDEEGGQEKDMEGSHCNASFYDREIVLRMQDWV